MGNFKNKAVAATTISELMENRTKISTDEVISKYPEGITITAFDWMKGENGQYPVAIFKENDHECFFGGAALTSICEDWMDGYEDTKSCSDDLAAEGGVKLKFTKSKTKNNRTFTKAEVVD